METIYPHRYPNGARRYSYVRQDGTLNKAALRAEIERRQQLDWVLSGAPSCFCWWSNARFMMHIARQQRDAVRGS